eukprot:2552328-Rhodomonas_salina.2
MADCSHPESESNLSNGVPSKPPCAPSLHPSPSLSSSELRGGLVQVHSLTTPVLASCSFFFALSFAYVFAFAEDFTDLKSRAGLPGFAAREERRRESERCSELAQ